MRWLLLRIRNNVFNIFFKSLIFIIILPLTVTISSEYSSVFFTGENSFDFPRKINKIPLNIETCLLRKRDPTPDLCRRRSESYVQGDSHSGFPSESCRRIQVSFR